MSYSAPPAEALPAAEHHPVIAIKAVVDDRTNGSHWLGAIRGGYGNPLKTLETDQPVKDVVAQAFSDALAARGMLAKASTESIEMTITIHRFDCNQYVRREAHADFEITLTNAHTGTPVYSDRVTADDVNGSVFAMDVAIFGSVDKLRMVAVGTMREAIDKALDKPAFLAAIASAGAA
ncbi:hypothetical protein [Acidisphaera sp. S103]|uniref:hypothetical protein n=1 Tax=Acidisphaera sp. S103 TaxID=1747223 RepID=UPI00131E758A|nr:hypothetical protein [Acidisphaera sp. S103]